MNTTPTAQTVKVWDLPVRLCHWGLAACVIANLLITEDGSNIHQYIGYTAVGIVAFRTLWGLIGTKHARFSDFFPTPTRLYRHITSLFQPASPEHESQHLGHNPLGALMMLALWGVIIGLGVSGYMMGLEAYWGDEMLEEIHEILANSLYPLIGLHVLAAVAMSYWSKINLVKAMITGNKTLPK